MNSNYCILLCFICILRLFPVTSSASLPSSMLDEFIAIFNENECKMPEQIVLQNITKYNVNSVDDIEGKPYDLAVPLAVCAAKVPPVENRDAELCNEVFEILTNISTCMLNNTVLQKIENMINISFEKEVCDGFAKYKNIFLKDPQFIALNLADKDICKLYCSGGEIYDACKFLLWSYRVQTTIYDQLKDWKPSNTQLNGIDKPAVSNKKENPSLDPTKNVPASIFEAGHSIDEDAHMSEIDARDDDDKKLTKKVNIDIQPHIVGNTLKTQSPSTGSINQNDAKSVKSQNVTKNVDISSLNTSVNNAISNTSMKIAKEVTVNIEKQTNVLSSAILTDISKGPSNNGKDTSSKQITVANFSPLRNVTVQNEKNEQTVQGSDTLVKHTGSTGQNENSVTSYQVKPTVKSNPSHNPQAEKPQGVDAARNEGQNENLVSSHQMKITIESDQLLTTQEENPEGDPITKDKKNNAKTTKTTEDNVKTIANDSKMTKNITKTAITVASVMDDNGSTIKKAADINNVADDKKIPSESLEKSSHKEPSNKKSTISLNSSKEDSLKSTNHPGGNKNGDTGVKSAGETDEEGATKLNTSSEDAQAQLEEMEDGGDDDPGNIIDDGSIDNSFDSFAPKSDPVGDTQQEHDSTPGKAKVHHTIDDGIGQSQNSVQVNGIPDDALDGRSMNGINTFPEQEDTHFFFYFLSIIVVIIGSYLVFHNKQKIIALIIEGRHEKKRRSHNISYKKLETK